MLLTLRLRILFISRKFSDQRERIGAGRAVARVWLSPLATLCTPPLCGSLMNNLSRLLAVLMITVFSPNARGQDEPAQTPAPVIKPSVDTTRITEPLDADGYVDYVAALNQIMAEGIDQQDNAAVLYIQAVGVDWMPESQRAKFLKQMGMKQSEIDASYRPLDQFEIDELTLDKVTAFPWKASDYPDAAKWLEQNQSALKLVRRGIRRKKFYLPLVPTEEVPKILTANDGGDERIRELSQLLAAHAMSRLQAGDYDAAWADVCQLHKMAAVISQSILAYPYLLAHGIQRRGVDAAFRIIERADWDADKRREKLKEFRALPRVRNCAHLFAVGERLAHLDSLVSVARYGPTRILGDRDKSMKAWITKLAGNAFFDWDQVLKNGNHWFDRVEKATAERDPAAREKALEQLEFEMDELIAKAQHPSTVALSLVSRKVATERFSTFMLMNVYSYLTFPNTEKRTNMLRQFVEIAFAATIFRSLNGSYPKSLEQLAENFDGSLTDPYSDAGEDYRFTSDGKTMKLRSVYLHGSDDTPHPVRFDIEMELR